MKTILVPQEVYLLERYSSLAYFGEMRDAFAAMLQAAEDALELFMKDLPPDYRSRHQSLQPDIVWGERVLPNLRWTMNGLRNGYLQLESGEYDGLGQAGNVTTAFAAISRDYSNDWMAQVYCDIYDTQERLSRKKASNVGHTERAEWGWGDLSSGYSPRDFGPLNPPPSWPQYQLNSKINVSTGGKVPQTGIYVPNAENSCAQFLIEDREAWHANVSEYVNADTYKSVPTTWTLVERIANSGGGIPGQEPASANLQATRIRVEGGQTCQEAGWYFTPVQNDSRRYFDKNVVMPSLAGDYGITIWQWDADQKDSAASGNKLSAKTGQICPQDGLWTLAQRPDVIASVYDGTEMPSFEGQGVTWVYLRPRS